MLSFIAGLLGDDKAASYLRADVRMPCGRISKR
jgi:hypothetical protein